MTPADLEALIERLGAEPAPELAGLPAGAVDVARSLESAPARATLDRLCRKIAVAKRLDGAYSRRWKRLKGCAPLSGSARAILVARLLLEASACLSGGGGERGWGLKCLNAALTALDLEDLPSAETPARVELAGATAELLGRVGRLEGEACEG